MNHPYSFPPKNNQPTEEAKLSSNGTRHCSALQKVSFSEGPYHKLMNLLNNDQTPGSYFNVVAHVLMKRVVGAISHSDGHDVALVFCGEERADIIPFQWYLNYAWLPTYDTQFKYSPSINHWEAMARRPAPEKVIVISDEYVRQGGIDILTYMVGKMIFIKKYGHLFPQEQFDGVYGAAAAGRAGLVNPVMRFLEQRRIENKEDFTYDLIKTKESGQRYSYPIVPTHYPTDTEIMLQRMYFTRPDFKQEGFIEKK